MTHMAVHTGLKRFECQSCGQRFSCISNLQAHRKSHKRTCGMTPMISKPIASVTLSSLSSISVVQEEEDEEMMVEGQEN